MKIIFENVSSFEVIPLNYREASLKVRMPVINSPNYGDGELEIEIKRCEVDLSGDKIIVKEIYSI
jgi:hypothetical protein